MMNKCLVFLFLLFSTNLFAGAPASKILIFGKTIRPAHAQIIPVAGAALADSLSKNGYETLFIQDPNQLDRTNLGEFRVLVLLDVSENVISANEKKAIEAFFEQGGGLIAVHASIAAGKDWPWLQGLLQTSFVDHAPIQIGTVRLVSASESVNESLPQSWSQTDEWYNFSNPVSSPAKILAVADESTFQGGKMGSPHPITWSREVTGGRFWYTALGHPAVLYTDANGNFSKALIQAVRWASKAI